MPNLFCELRGGSNYDALKWNIGYQALRVVMQMGFPDYKFRVYKLLSICKRREPFNSRRTHLVPPSTQTVQMHPAKKICAIKFVLDFVLWDLYLETTRTTATTGTFEFSSVRSHVRLYSIVSVGVVDGDSVSEVSKSISGLGTTEQDSICSLRGLKSELVECQAFSSGGNNALSGILCEAKGAYGHFWAFQHADVVGYFSYNDGSLSFLLAHVLRKSMEANRWLVDLTHVKALQDSRTELGVGSAGQELVQLDQESVVRILGLHNLHGTLVPRAAAACL